MSSASSSPDEQAEELTTLDRMNFISLGLAYQLDGIMEIRSKLVPKKPGLNNGAGREHEPAFFIVHYDGFRRSRYFPSPADALIALAQAQGDISGIQ